MNKKRIKKQVMESGPELRSRIREWLDAVEAGKQSDVWLSNFVMNWTDSGRLSSCVVNRGYGILQVHFHKGHALKSIECVYSPLLKKFLGTPYSVARALGDTSIPYRRIDPALLYWLGEDDCGHPDIGLPLSDEMSRRLALAGCVSEGLDGNGMRSPRSLLLTKRDADMDQHDRSKLSSLLFGEMDDIVLGLVTLIDKMPRDKRDEIFRLYDEIGSPNNWVGQALDHMDKFRSY